MDAWILNGDDALSDQVRQMLLKMPAGPSIVQVVDRASVERLIKQGGQTPFFILLTIESITGTEIEFVRRIRAATTNPVAVISSSPKHELMLRVIRAGANDYLNGDGRLECELREFVARVSSSASQGQSKGRLISIVPCHVPSDASVLATNVAAIIAKQSGTCALFDLHLRGGDLALLLKADPRHTVLDVLKRHSIDDAIFQQALTVHSSGIRLLAGPPLFNDLTSIDPSVCKQLLSLAQNSHSFVVVNCEDVVHAEQAAVLNSSDEVMLTMRLDVISLHRAKQHLEFIARNRMVTSRIHVVPMGTGTSGELNAKLVRQVLGVKELHCIPEDSAGLTMSINVGNPLVLEQPHSKTSRAIAKLTSQMIGYAQREPCGPKKQIAALFKSARMLISSTTKDRFTPIVGGA
jgi:Flp pilus assembly CpaE family ATPase